MLVLNLKVYSDKLINDIVGKDNSSETAPKPAVYGSINRPILKAANNLNTQPKISEEQEYYLHLYETQHDKLFNKSDNSPQKIKVYTYVDEQSETHVEKQADTYVEEPIHTYAEKHKLPWYVRLINFIKDLFNKIFKRNKN